MGLGSVGAVPGKPRASVRMDDRQVASKLQAITADIEAACAAIDRAGTGRLPVDDFVAIIDHLRCAISLSLSLPLSHAHRNR